MRILLVIIGLALPVGVFAAGLGGLPHSPALVGSLVKSKEWRIIRKPERIEEFIGDVRYWTSERVIQVDWARFRHKTRTWEFRGNLEIEHTVQGGGGVMKARGHEGFYDQAREKGSVKPEPGELIEFILTRKDGEHQGEARLFKWKTGKFATLLGDVHVSGPIIDSWSDQADFDWENDVLHLTGGRPVFRYASPTWIGAFQAERIKASRVPALGPQGHILEADEKVKGWIRFKAKP